MLRTRACLTAATAALLATTLAGCGGSAQPEADPTPTSSRTASPSPSPSPTAQPTGADGVTVDVLNWSRYRDDPTVLSWKRTFEALQASANTRRIVPRLLDGTTPALRRGLVKNLQNAWRKKWHVPPTMKVRVEKVTGKSSKKVLVSCVWGPSYSFYDTSGKAVAENERAWFRFTFDLRASGTDWRVAAIKVGSKCPGGAPQ